MSHITSITGGTEYFELSEPTVLYHIMARGIINAQSCYKNSSAQNVVYCFEYIIFVKNQSMGIGEGIA